MGEHFSHYKLKSVLFFTERDQQWPQVGSNKSWGVFLTSGGWWWSCDEGPWTKTQKICVQFLVLAQHRCVKLGKSCRWDLWKENIMLSPLLSFMHGGEAPRHPRHPPSYLFPSWNVPLHGVLNYFAAVALNCSCNLVIVTLLTSQLVLMMH